MELNNSALEEFKDNYVRICNEQVYDELKYWVNRFIDDDQDFEVVIEFFLNNLHGSVAWINDETQSN